MERVDRITRCLWRNASHYLAVYIILAVAVGRTGCDDSQDFQKNIPVRVVWTALGRNADLPCDLTPPTPHDSVKLLLWFKDTTGIPLYSLDSRKGDIKLATHSAIASDLGQRLFFSISDNPKDSRLQIRNVKTADGGVYRCRVDFFNSPTRNFRINLTLVVPPEEPRIFDAQGKEISAVAGPFREGYELFLSCQVNGGRPLPKVTWWRDGVEIFGKSQHSIDEGVAAVVSPLFIGTVTREFFGSKLECRAQGSKLIPAVTKTVTLQVHLKPLRAKIVTANDLLTAGQAVPVRCETWGSYPPAKVLWLLDGEAVRNPDVTVYTNKEDSNITVSILTLRVTSENDGAELTCRASNPWFSGEFVEDTRVISVAYPPTVSVHLANEDPSRVVTRAEGQNVTLKCRADARPPVTSFSWFKNGMRMSGENIETLQLTFLERESAGSYACGAMNTEGETRSSGLTLKVQYAPRCKPGTEQTSVGAVDSSTISVRCEVDADPPDSVRFSWTYNNTRNVSPVLNSRVQSEGLVSTMTYLPPTDSEFITLACWASNSVGRQTTPCLVHVLPAKIPEAPKSCELHNDTILEVICIPGNDGGLIQHFLLEAIGTAVTDSTESMRNRIQELDSENELSTMNDQATSAPLHRIQEAQPQFRLNNLEPGREYQLFVYAINAKGRSNPPVVLDKVRVSPHLGPYDETILSEDPTPAETTHQSNEKQSTMVILAAVIAGAAVIVTSIIVAGVVVVCKQRPKPPEPQEVRKRMRPARKDVPSMYIEEDGFNDEDLGRPAEIRHHSRASTGPRNTRYVSEGFVQYSQPSLSDPDLILPRGDEFTSPTVTSGGA
ncbi:unnamed protein product [Hermetia illucens]|uniref:Ig-like domain-containing protein n=1 Tax=Hermetia illucens TaxID=343691 RepID=A0A7R8YTJ1_HERIL|nr:hemicentin-1 isoform X2 [Hermetia illucens]CAD7085072.1 unnamed protein product [Hermetia illucens]